MGAHDDDAIVAGGGPGGMLAAAMGECIALRRRDPTSPLPFPECAGANESGGVRALVQSLRRALAARAVEVRLGWSVEQIAIESGSVRGVWTRDSLPFREFLGAPTVISNLAIWTLFDVVPPEKLLWPHEWVTRDGSEYMIAAAPRPPVRAPGVRGLFFVGETTDVPAVRMDAAALSSLRAADMIAAE